MSYFLDENYDLENSDCNTTTTTKYGPFSHLCSIPGLGSRSRESGVGGFFGGRSRESGVGKKWPTPDSQIWLPISEIFSGSKICRGEGAGSRESVGFLGWKSRESGVGKARESETQSTDSQALLNTHTHTIPRTYVHVYVHTQTHKHAYKYSHTLSLSVTHTNTHNHRSTHSKFAISCNGFKHDF